MTIFQIIIIITIHNNNNNNNSDIITYAWIGRTDVTDSTEDFEEIPIHREVIHPQYDLETWSHDAMILELEYPV
jgi:hypothetical protein